MNTEKDVKKTDRRVRYTKKVLSDSLIDLLYDNEISKITITAVCERADINRGTFYSYYSDPHDLLACIEEELYSEISATLDKYTLTPDGAGIYSAFNSLTALREIFACLSEKRKLCMALLGKNGDSDFLFRILNIGRDRCVSDWSAALGTSNIAEVENIYSFVVSGSMGVVRSWADRGMKEDPDQIAAFIDTMTREGMMGFSKK